MNRKLLSLLIIISSISVAACQQKTDKSDKVVLTPSEFETKVSETKESIVLDVCTPGEFERQHIANALNINYNGRDFETHLSQLDKDKPYFVYCWAGTRSANAAKLMREMGFEQVYELKGGIANWMKQNKPVESDRAKEETHNLYFLDKQLVGL